MRFALLGDHPDGLDMARALTASGRHALYLYSGPPAGLQHLQRLGLTPRAVVDLETLLVDANLDAVIVAGGPTVRAAQLRRALQSECHVLCVHPADPSPNIAYEAAMIQADVGRVLLPLLPMTLHPGLQCFRKLPIQPRVIEFEIWSTDEVLAEIAVAGHPASLPCWDVLRFVGGEIAEVFVLSSAAELSAGLPVVVSGRFLSGSIFQATYLPNQAESRWRLALVTLTGRATFEFPQGWPGPAQLAFTDGQGIAQNEAWDAVDPWTALVERFEQAVEVTAVNRPQPGKLADETLTKTPPILGWQDELRCLELNDAARRSVERGRSSTLDFQESTEEASFKGTMTLVGCSLIWLTLIVLILSAWLPWLAWFIVPVMLVFLLLQTLHWIVPRDETTGTKK